jgi:hypothetical protein
MVIFMQRRRGPPYEVASDSKSLTFLTDSWELVNNWLLERRRKMDVTPESVLKSKNIFADVYE